MTLDNLQQTYWLFGIFAAILILHQVLVLF